MKFFGVHIEDLESEAFIAATAAQVAGWLFMHAYCSKQCNGGTIAAAASMTERFWSRHGIEKAVVESPSPLWSWEGDALTLAFYDIAGQTLFEKKVAGGKAGGRGRKNRTPDRTPIETPQRTPDRYNSTLPNSTQTPLALNGASSCSPLEISWNPSDGFSGITEQDRHGWAEAYPAVNITRQLAAASEWLKSNPAKRKKNHRRFITSWLSRQQERGGDIPSNPPPRTRDLRSDQVGI